MWGCWHHDMLACYYGWCKYVDMSSNIWFLYCCGVIWLSIQDDSIAVTQLRNYWLPVFHIFKGRTIQPKLDRTDPVKSAASESAIQYQSDTDSDLPWTVRKYMSISKRKCKILHKWCGACNSAVSDWHWLHSAVNQSHTSAASAVQLTSGDNVVSQSPSAWCVCGLHRIVYFGQGSSLLWTHMLRPFYSRPIALTQERRSLVNDVCEHVHDWRVREGWVGMSSLSGIYSVQLVGVAYCLALVQLTDACYSTSATDPVKSVTSANVSATDTLRLLIKVPATATFYRGHCRFEPSVACPGLSPWSSCA